MNTKKLLRLLALVGMLALTSTATSQASAQDTGAFPLTAFSAYCDPGYLGPFEGCTPWEGVTVSMTSADGAFATSCTTAGTERAASCAVDVPFGSVITASIDPAVIPAGYVLEGASTQEFVIPDGPPDGIFGGPVFVLLPAEPPVEPTEPAAEEGFPLGAASAFCEPGYLGPFVGCTPWEGLTVTFVSADGSFSASCVTSGTDRAAGCGLDVPFGSTIIASIDPTVVPIDYVLEGAFEQTFEIPAGPPEGLFGGPVFVLLPYEGGEDTHERPDDSDSGDVVEQADESGTGETVDQVADESTASPDEPIATSLPSTGAGVAEHAPPVMAAAAILAAVTAAGAVIVRVKR